MESFLERMERRLEEIENLPALPSTVASLRRAVNDPEASAEDIAGILSLDPSLASKVLSIANSALYAGSSGRITSIPAAVARVGFREVGNLFTTAAVLEACRGTGRGLDHVRFWKHCLTSAVAGRVLQRHGDLGSGFCEEDAYMAGLVHDIGVLIFDQYFPAVLEQVWRVADEKGRPHAAVERLVLKTDHGHIGSLLLKRWNLPEAIVNAVAYHHEPDAAPEEHRDLARVVYFADAVCTQMGIGDGGDGAAADFDDGIWDRLGLRVEEFPEVVAEIESWARRSEAVVASFGG